MSFGKKAVAAPISSVARPAARAGGAAGTGTLPWAPIAVGLGAVLIVLFAVFFVIIPTVGGDAQQADPLGGSWRAPLADMCPAPTVNADALPSARKTGLTLAVAAKTYANRAEDLTKLGRHIACAAQHNPGRMCSPAARAEFMGHVKKYATMRAEMIDRIAASASKPSPELEQYFPEYMTTEDAAQASTRLSERERQQVSLALQIVVGDPNVLGGLEGLLEDGYIEKPEFVRAIGSKPGAMTSFMKVEPKRKACR